MSELLFSCCHYGLYANQRLRNDDLALTRLTNNKKHNLARNTSCCKLRLRQRSSSTSLRDNGGISDNVKVPKLSKHSFLHKRLIILIMFSVGLSLKTFLWKFWENDISVFECMWCLDGVKVIFEPSCSLIILLAEILSASTTWLEYFFFLLG